MRGAMSRVAALIGPGAVLAAVISAALLPAAGHGYPQYPPECGSRVTSGSHKDVGRGRSPLAIGDSVMLLAVEGLADKGYRVDAQGCRTFGEAISLLKDERDKLPHLVVLALGADDTISTDQIRKALRVLGRRHHEARILGLVTPRELGGGSGQDAQNILQAGEKFPKRIEVLDWVKKSAGNPGWFQPDGLHLTYSGADAFTQLLKKALPLAPWSR
jgi:hypothetical protein